MSDEGMGSAPRSMWNRRYNVDRPLLVTIVCCSVVAIMVMLGTTAFLVIDTGVNTRPLAFDAERWRREPATLDHSSVRLRMVDDLLDQSILTGLARKEVIHLLGNPERTDYFSDWDLVYVLGPECGFISVDYEWLLIRLDESGHVFDATTATD